MYIDVKEFIAHIASNGTMTIETKTYFPKLREELRKIRGALKDDELTNTVIGRQILGHSYGYELALLFKKWVFATYPISSEVGIYDPIHNKVVLE